MNGELPFSSIEKITLASKMLSEAKYLDDILKINDLAEAAITYAKAANLGLEAQNKAAELALRAKRKAGEILGKLEREPGKRTDITLSIDGQGTEYSEVLEESGTSRQDANRWQMISSMPDDKFEEHIAETKADGKELTTSGLIRVAKFEAVKDKISPPTITGKYRIIYADPPWKYGDQFLIEGYKISAEQHYPVMAIDELCSLPIKEICEDNAVLFLWATSPLLEESFRVIKAWGFEYKTSFVWDKVKHNMGHYNSVRHEFLLVCTRGSCTPDNPKLYDSVLSIERTEHSVKPDEFRAIIDDLYQNGNRIELFARRPANGWNVWGNEPNIS